jgi:hypothetical protein
MAKQNTLEWKIAESYWLSSFTIALVVSLVGASIMGFSNVFLNTDQVIDSIVLFFVSLVGIWVGAIYAGKSISKKYTIKNKEDIIIKILALNLVISLILVTGSKLSFIMVPEFTEILENPTYSTDAIASIGIYTSILFYLYMSIRYIKPSN